jgi:hypothetical protein
MNEKIINRIEIIGPNGREFVRYLKDDEEVQISMQDNKKTMKIFIDKSRSQL